MSKSSVFQSVSVTESDLPNLLTQVQTSENNAANSAAAAATSAASVGTSASDATTEASNAANSATASANSASTSAASASAAAASENNASTHVTTASGHATGAANSATSATNSQAAATQSATDAASSATNAATSATNAATSETNAATSASAASTSASAASTSVTNAAAEVTNAAAEATAAAASATAAAASESAASTSETNAQTHSNTASGHATTASTQATNAATSATAAATSETNAGTQATNAATSATAAAGSATNAATAQTAAESARDSALAAFDNFDDRYLGAKTSDPSTDNDGNTLVAGTLYFNSSTSTMMLYTGSAWVAAYVSGGSFAALSGATFTGDVTVPNLITAGNVDGRDVSVDGTKLDGIAANATAVSSLTDLSISDGTNGQALKTDGSGNFSFGDVTSSVAFADITGKPTTLSGYGITDAVAQLADTSSPNYQTPSSRRVDPNGDNPTNEHYAITTFGNGSNVTGQLAAHFQTGQLYSRGYNSSFSTWRKIWNDQNDGSGSGLDADLLDGYHASTTRNSANTIPIRNSSGYLDLGWINTTSGATTNTINKIYSSNDDYLRYVTPATFRAQVISNQTINEIYNDGWYRTNGARGWYNQTYGGGIYMTDSTYVRTYGSKQLYVNTHIKAASNVYAYWSDDRLKTKIGNIDNALDKVQSLSGFTYTRNDVAKSHGFDGDEVEVGVSAQQVKAVLPEAIHLAPFDEKVEDDGTIVSKSGEDYMTVDYPRLVPLLIEAIKELKAEVDELKAGCCHAATD